MDETLDQKLKAIEETVMWHSVGIVANSETALGTGIALKWRGRSMILTANHVIADTENDSLRFFFRHSGNLELTDARRSTFETQIFKKSSSISIMKVEREENEDLATIQVDPSVAIDHNCRFFELRDCVIPPSVEQTVLIVGFPSDIARLVRPGEMAAFASAEWTNIEEDRELKDHDPKRQFLMRYNSAEENRHPRGFSGGGVWFRMGSSGEIWHANLGLAGIVTTYFAQSQLLEAVKIDYVSSFLNSRYPDKSREKAK